MEGRFSYFYLGNAFHGIPQATHGFLLLLHFWMCECFCTGRREALLSCEAFETPVGYPLTKGTFFLVPFKNPMGRRMLEGD